MGCTLELLIVTLSLVAERRPVVLWSYVLTVGRPDKTGNTQALLTCACLSCVYVYVCVYVCVYVRAGRQAGGRVHVCACARACACVHHRLM